MLIERTAQKPTQVSLRISADDADLRTIKEYVLTSFRSRIKLPGFREGKAPLELVEKNVDQRSLQNEVLEEAVQRLYAAALDQEKLRPVAPPEVSLKKFVPFTALEFEADVAVIGDLKLPDYTKIKKAKKSVNVTDKDIEEVVATLKKRLAEKTDVQRTAKAGDQAWIDFKGVDEEGEPVKGAEGKDYPLILGSDTFIPGFEDNVIGMAAGEEKTFKLTFPKDYGVKALAGKKVTFTVTVSKVQEVTEPKADDEFAKQAGPFASLAELTADIRRQVTSEREHEAARDYEAELIKEITAKSKLQLPKALIKEQIEMSLRELKQNLAYRGLTWQEFLEREGKSEEEYKEAEVRPQAEQRLKASLVLAEIAEKEKIRITPEDLEMRMQTLKSQYKDAAMQTELDKPQARRDIASRILTEKTIERLVGYASK